MTQINSLNAKLSNSQLNKLKSAAKNETSGTLRLSPNMAGESNHEIDFSQKLLLTERQLRKLRKDFAINSSFNIKLSKTQLPKIVQQGGFFGRLLGPFLKTGLLLMKNVRKPLTKSV